ncbi:MAG: trehalose-phosphatase [Chloroflexi bacterium]|nr:trehalose-phosphatase [Chloroflexota bacterium]
MSLTSRRPPNLLANFDSAIGDLNADSLALVLDFDGTLSEFVPVLENAVIHPDVVPPLRRLTNRLALVGVMSGRAARDVERRVGIVGIVYIGNHGVERIVDGTLSASEGSEEAEHYLQGMLESLADAADDPGLVLENKRYSASLHYRRATDEAGVVERLRAAVESMPDMGGFELSWGNKILEIRARNGVNKGVALDWLIEKWRPNSVVFLGDDTTDADALQALQQRKASGAIDGIGIAVIQDGTPASVFDSADYSLNGVPEVVLFLSRLQQALIGRCA